MLRGSSPIAAISSSAEEVGAARGERFAGPSEAPLPAADPRSRRLHEQVIEGDRPDRAGNAPGSRVHPHRSTSSLRRSGDDQTITASLRDVSGMAAYPIAIRLSRAEAEGPLVL